MSDQFGFWMMLVRVGSVNSSPVQWCNEEFKKHAISAGRNKSLARARQRWRARVNFVGANS
ncbi:MAG: hypothetical protein GY820_12755 [Gammaproteobacteria bacterium]|nr:hypothetical protein [Gammaproteobacteria bacterium]